MTLARGTRLGAYEVLEPIGEGGMGAVYRAADTKLQREVAIKVLPAEVARDPERLHRFEREARAVAALSHPNIVAIHDFADEGGRVYAVMELLEGETLAERLRGGALPQRKAIEIACQIAQGLAAAHDKNVTHRDLKPQNVFLTGDGRVKILDFGLARAEEAAPRAEDSELVPTKAAGTSPGVVMGTVGYMSPEQVRGERADHRSDVFSFGAVLYEMLSGSRAFQRDTAAETMAAILKEDPLERLEALKPALSRIVERCLEKKREERFQSAHDLAFALDSLTRESGGSAALDIATPRQWIRGFGLASAVAALVLVAYFFGKSRGSADIPALNYQRLTFQRGTVFSGRFDPTGRDIVYSAAWDGGAVELFSTLPGSNESTALGIADADVLSVSTRGELALLRKERRLPWEDLRGITGTLFRSFPSGAARPIAEDVLVADWTPDGESLAVVRRVDSQWSVELPPGTGLYETPSLVDGLQLSSDGRWLAFGEKSPGFGSFWSIVFVDRGGHKTRFETGVGGDYLDLAWSPDGSEVWFNTFLGAGPDWMAMSTDGKMRLVLRPPIALRILDVSKDGRVLAVRTSDRIGVMGLAPGDDRERDFSWLDSTEIDGISRDGRTLLLTELGEGAGFENWSVFLRESDRSPAVRLGGGQAFDLSSDGKWALTMRVKETPSLVLLPTGIGEPVELPRGELVNFSAGSWSPDGEHVIFAAAAKDSGTRYYRQDLAGLPEPITPEDRAGDFRTWLGARPVSPDGKTLAVTDLRGAILLYPIETDSEPTVVPEVSDAYHVVRWSPDGRFLYVLVPRGLSFEVQRIEVATGRRTLWNRLDSIDPVGLVQLYAVQIADDEKSYYYTFERTISDLFLIQGLR